MICEGRRKEREREREREGERERGPRKNGQTDGMEDKGRSFSHQFVTFYFQLLQRELSTNITNAFLKCILPRYDDSYPSLMRP